MKKILAQLAGFILALAPAVAQAGGDQVVVVYNNNMPGSRDVAEYYARMRQVPQNQIYGFDLTTNEEMSRDDFRDSLQWPLARKLEGSGLWKFGKTIIPAKDGSKRLGRCVVSSKIRYAVLCYGVPLKIAADPDSTDPGPKDLPGPFRRDDASVDSELAWLPLVDTKPTLVGPMFNWVYGATNAALLDPTNGILLVARLDGPSPELARGLVDKALQADRDGLWGHGYFDARGLARTNTYYLGDEWILSAAVIWRDSGFETVVDDRPETFPADFPMSQIALYCGWYDGNVSGPFTLPRVEFMPGAFAYHLYSFSAATIRDPNHGWVGTLIAKGATATMGCVNEPFLALTPNVAIFLSRWMGGKFTYGEAAWAAQAALSWQTTVVGDPLYNPFQTPPQVKLQELADRHSPLVEWPLLRAINLAYLHGRLPGQLTDILENLPETTNSSVLTEKLALLDVAQGHNNAAVDANEKAQQ